MATATEMGPSTNTEFTTEFTTEYTTEFATEFATEKLSECLPECVGLGLQEAGPTCLDPSLVGYGYVCPDGFFNTGDCCLDQWWIIGIAAGAGAVIIIILVSVVIWLSMDRRKQKKKAKSVENGSTVNELGEDETGYDNRMSGILHQDGSGGDVNKSTAELLVHSDNPRSDDGIVTGGNSAEGAKGLENIVRARQSKHNPQKQHLPHTSETFYDDIEHYHPERHNQPAEDASEVGYYNTSDVRKSYVAPREPELPKRNKEEAIPAGHKYRLPLPDITQDDAAKYLHHGIDLRDFENFEPTLEHVDPNADYTIRRPKFAGR